MSRARKVRDVRNAIATLQELLLQSKAEKPLTLEQSCFSSAGKTILICNKLFCYVMIPFFLYVFTNPQCFLGYNIIQKKHLRLNMTTAVFKKILLSFLPI